MVIASLVASCGGAQRVPDGPLTVGQWCDEIGPRVCAITADQCFGGMAGFEDGCRDQFTPSCVAGRSSSAPANRVGADLDRCLAALDGASCDELGGVLMQSCALDAP